ncbi:MAG: GAF domain-containing protein, partial [Chloroflexota bacterium]
MLDPKRRESLRQKWVDLIEPHPSVIDPVRRQTAHTLAALTLFLAIVIIPVAPVMIGLFGVNLIVVLVFFEVGYLFVYWLSRGRYPLAGSLVLVLGISLGVIGAVLTFPGSIWESVLVWLILPVILSALLLPLRFAVVMSVIIFIMLTVTGSTFPASAATSILNSELVVFFVAIIMHFAQYLRESVVKRLQERNLQLVASESLYADLFNDIPIGLFEIVRGGILTNINQASVEILGFPDRETLLKTPVANLFSQLSEFRQWQTHPPTEPTTFNLELQLRTADGRLIWAKVIMKAEPAADGRGMVYKGSIEDSTERKQAQLFEFRQRRLAEVLRDTAMAVTLSLDLDAVLDLISSNLERVVMHSTFNLMLVEGNKARIVRRKGYEENERISLGTEPDSLVINDVYTLRSMKETGQPVMIQDTETDPHWIQDPNQQWLRSYLGVPIAIGGKIGGFINLDSIMPNGFSEQDAGNVMAFAAQAGLALNNASLFSELKTAKDAAESADRAKSTFLATMSH